VPDVSACCAIAPGHRSAWPGGTNLIPTICSTPAPNHAPAALVRRSGRHCSYSTVSPLSSRHHAFTATATWACWHECLLTGKLPCDRERLDLAGQRPSSLNATGLIIESRSTTRSGPTGCSKAAPETHVSSGTPFNYPPPTALNHAQSVRRQSARPRTPRELL
jgi:hypothetical protein